MQPTDSRGSFKNRLEVAERLPKILSRVGRGMRPVYQNMDPAAPAARMHALDQAVACGHRRRIWTNQQDHFARCRAAYQVRRGGIHQEQIGILLKCFEHLRQPVGTGLGQAGKRRQGGPRPAPRARRQPPRATSDVAGAIPCAASSTSLLGSAPSSQPALPRPEVQSRTSTPRPRRASATARLAVISERPAPAAAEAMVIVRGTPRARSRRSPAA